MDNNTRRKLFNIVRDYLEITIEQFADECNVKKQMISQVLLGTSKSARIEGLIDDFINEHLPEIQLAIGANKISAGVYTLTEYDDHLILSIIETGMEIKKESMVKLFDRIYNG